MLSGRRRAQAGFACVGLAAVLGAVHGVGQARRERAARAADPSERASAPDDGSAARSPARSSRIDPGATARANDALRRGREAFERGAWDEARGHYEAARDASADADLAVRSTLRSTALRSLGLSRLLLGLSADLRPSPFVGRGDLVEVELFGQRTYVARILGEGPDVVELELSTGVKLRFAPTDLTARRPCSQQSWQERALQRLDERARDADLANPLELYRLAWFAVEHGLVERGRTYLQSAALADRLGVLARTFCRPEHRPDDEERALIYEGTSASLAAAQRTRRDLDRAHEEIARGGLARPRADPRAVAVGRAEAAGAMRAAIEQYALSYRLTGKPAADALARAEAGFRDARAALEEVLERAPDDRDALEELREVQQFLTDCAKASRLSE